MNLCVVQAHQERSYQEYVASKAMEKSQKQEGYYEQLLSLNQTELTCKTSNEMGNKKIRLLRSAQINTVVSVMLCTHPALKSQVGSLRKDLETVKTKYNKVSEKLTDKTRQYQKLQVETCKSYWLSHVASCHTQSM